MAGNQIKMPDGSVQHVFNPYISPSLCLKPGHARGNGFMGDDNMHWNGTPIQKDINGYVMNPPPHNPHWDWVNYERNEANARASETKRVAQMYPNPDAAIAYLHATQSWPDMS